MMKRIASGFAGVMGFLLILATPASAYTIADSWDMASSAVPGISEEQSGSNRDLFMNGDYIQTGPPWAARWLSAPAWGVVDNSDSQDPGTSNHAIGARFTIDDGSVSGGSYNGKVIQFGQDADAGYLQMELIPDASGGTIKCRAKGATTSTEVSAQVGALAQPEGDEYEYLALCYNTGTKVGVRWVPYNHDGWTYTEATVTVGSVAFSRDLVVGNKGSNGTANGQHLGSNTCSAYSYGGGSINQVQDILDSNCTL